MNSDQQHTEEFIAGMAAFDSGKQWHDNPHVPDSAQYRQWGRGYNYAYEAWIESHEGE